MRHGTIIAVLLACALRVQCAEKHVATGLVLDVDPSHRAILVSCDKMEGHATSSVLRLAVHSPESLARLVPGVMVNFKLVEERTGRYAEDIEIREFQSVAQQASAARRLEIVEDLTSSGTDTHETLQIRQHVPKTILIDQNRREIDVAGFSGRVVVLNFFYTHCPLPDYCFRLSNNLGNIQSRFSGRLGSGLVLLSISFDPVHDQPEVLENYARTWHAGPNWHFLTGETSTVRNICRLFGVNSWPDEAELMHSLHTVIIDREGRLAANLEGNEFTAQQLGDLVEVILNR
jgi:protein SCO1